MKPKKSRRRRVLRLIGLLILVYFVAGFVTRHVAWVSGSVAHVARAALPPPPGPVLSGVSSVHTERSHDAVGSLADVAEAARGSELDFVLIGDHPTPNGPTVGAVYMDSLLIGFGDELVVEETGRVLLFGLPAALDRRDWGVDEIEELVTNRGATAAIIHGRSPRERERWRIPDAGPAEAWEVMDVSEAARRAQGSFWVGYHAAALLLGAVTGQLDEALVGMDRVGFEAPGVAAFDSLTARTQLTAMGALNHHPKAEIAGILLPPYGPFFRTLVNHIHLPALPPAEPELALEHLASAIRDGRVHFSVGDVQDAAIFRLTAQVPSGASTPMGGATPLKAGLTLRTNILTPPGGRVLFKVVRNGVEVARLRGATLEFPVREPGVYRVEVFRYAGRIGDVFVGLQPWIFSNPVWVGME